MKLVDDLHTKPQSAFINAAISFFCGLQWLPEIFGAEASDHRRHVIPLFGAVFFLTGALALFLRGCQMRRKEKRQ